jgi:hypothetical protein
MQDAEYKSAASLIHYLFVGATPCGNRSSTRFACRSLAGFPRAPSRLGSEGMVD